MFALLKRPLGRIRNEISGSSNTLYFSHQERSLSLGLATGFLLVGYSMNAYTHFSGLLITKAEDASVFSLLLAIASVIVFLPLFLRVLVLSKRLIIQDGILHLQNFWPLPFLRSKIDITHVDGITITTLFSHLSQKASFYITILTSDNKVYKQVCTCPRTELNALVRRLSDLFNENGLTTRVSNENVVAGSLHQTLPSPLGRKTQT